MYPILGRYGPFFLYSYTVIMGIGVLAGLGLAAWQARLYDAPSDWLDGALAALLVGLVGGRAGFVWREWAYFQERPSQIFQFQQGGLTYHGALLAGLAGWWGWQAWRKRPFTPCANLFAPSLALTSAFGWFACWLEGCAYGRAAIPGSVLAADLPDAFGVYAWRYQTQLLGAGMSLLVFILAAAWRRRPAGNIFWLVLLALSLGRAGISYLRGDSAPQIAAIRIDTLLDTMLAFISLLLLKYTSVTQDYSTTRRQD